MLQALTAGGVDGIELVEVVVVALDVVGLDVVDTGGDVLYEVVGMVELCVLTTGVGVGKGVGVTTAGFATVAKT